MGSFNPNKIGNKLKRQEQHLKTKKQKESTKRDERLKRRRTEEKTPGAREARRAKNVPATIESKRTWDEAELGADDEGTLGLSLDVLHPKRRKVEGETLVAAEINPEDHLGDVVDDEEPAAVRIEESGKQDDEDDDLDSMLGSDSEDEVEVEDSTAAALKPPDRDGSEAPSAATSAATAGTAGTAATDLANTPEALMLKFPSLFNIPADKDPKVLVTTSINATIH